jgi:type IV secretory pathway VirB6-like protein
MASLGVGLVLTVLLFVSFFIVLMRRGIILYVLLAIVPIIIVLYFFDFTQKAGDRLFKLLIAHLLVSTVWITIFAIAFDFPTQFAPGSAMYLLSSALAPIAAAVINSILYFKIVTFFGTYETAILSRAHPIGRIIERRHEIIKTIKERKARLPQTKLTSYLK